MNTQQENKHAMHLATQRCLEDNSTKMSSFTKYAGLKISLDNNLNLAGLIIKDQAKNRTGITTSKTALRTGMDNLTMTVSICLVSYATIEEIPELLASAKIAESNLSRIADSKVKEIAQNILDLGNLHKAKLADYGLVAGDLERLQGAIDGYFESFTKPGKSRVEHTNITAQLKMNQKVTDSLIKRIDTLVATQARSEPVFHDQYFATRKIVHTGSRKRALDLQVVHAGTLQPIAKARVTLKNKQGTELTKSVKSTSPLGRNYYQSLLPSHYECMVEFLGFETTTVAFDHNAGITTKLTIELKPIAKPDTA